MHLWGWKSVSDQQVQEVLALKTGYTKLIEHDSIGICTNWVCTNPAETLKTDFNILIAVIETSQIICDQPNFRN